MFPLLFLLHIGSFNRADAKWQQLTTERYRIDMHTLDMVRQLQQVPRLYLPLQLSTLETRCRRWIVDNLLCPQSPARLRLTRHLCSRLLAYRNRPARNGKFIELYPDEVTLALSLPQRIDSQWQYDLVEIGLNEYGNVCKLALLLPLIQFLAHAGNRKMFLLVGCDGGLKSLYTVQGSKTRQTYQVDDTSITPLNIAELVARGV